MAKKRPRTGTLFDLVEILDETVETGTDGADVRTWTTVRRTRAAVEPMSGREFQLADQTRADVTHQITFRATPLLEISPRHRIRRARDGKIFEVTSVTNPDSRYRYNTVLCKEIVS